ncbi:MAG TPA: hypothetical protein VFZ61_13735 [Polyangiales bacterium]
MAKPKIAPPKKVDVAQAASQVELPGIKWKVVGTIVAGFAALWVVALMATQSVGYWGVGIVGGLTLGALGVGLYVWRMIGKQREILDLMKGAGDEEGRRRAIEQLGAAGSKDAMKALAHAQLLAQEDPQKAIEALEAIDIEKAPALAQDEVRCQRAMMYLFMNRPKDARPLADDIKIDRQPEPKAKAKYVAVVAEAFARTGKADEAKKLLQEYKADDPRWGAEVGPLLYRAQVYTFMETKNRGLAKRALDALIQIEPNMLSPFLQKGANPELQKLALAALSDAGLAPRAQMKMRQKL